jgi:hypothetical protein
MNTWNLFVGVSLGKQAGFTGLFVAHLVSDGEFGALVG